VAGRGDVLVKAGPMPGRMLEHWRDWRMYLRGASAEGLSVKVHRHEAVGRPLGSRAFVEEFQALLGRAVLPQKRGAKPNRTRKRNRV
jgi:hypothetical protein